MAYVILLIVHYCLSDGYSMLNALVEGFGQQCQKMSNFVFQNPKKRNFWENITCYTFPFSEF